MLKCNTINKNETLFLGVAKILIVSATKAEVQPLLNKFGLQIETEEGVLIPVGEENIFLLITGIGMVNTAYHLGRLKGNYYDYAIQAGIGGAFNRALKVGQVINVVQDTLSEMGAEDDEKFIMYPDLGLGGTNTFISEVSENLFINLTKVNAITVNKVHGNEQSIKKTLSVYKVEVESMEGAAFLMAAKDLTKNYFQIRAISNYVERRDKSKWDIPLAIKNLNAVLIEAIESIKE